MKFKAIGFDYHGVIGGGGKTGAVFSSAVCELLEISREQYNEVYFSNNHLLNTGEISSFAELLKIILNILGKSDKFDEVMKISERVNKDYTNIDPNIFDLLIKLRTDGYKLGLLSNATVESGNLLRSKGIDKYFDAFLISAEIGFQKPQVGAFQVLAKSLNVPISKLIFIDDSEKSLSTAKDCGFTPILFKNFVQLKEELKKKSIL